MNNSETLQLLKGVLDRPIAFYPVFARVGKGIVQGLFLSQCWYWTHRTNDRQGWFYKTQEDWHEELGMSRREQETARMKLKELRILEEERRGIPAKLYYRLNKAQLLVLLKQECGIALDGDELELNNHLQDLERMIELYQSRLLSLSRLGYNRATQAKVHAVFVDYAEVLRKSDGKCYYCLGLLLEGPGQKGQALQFDHIIPIAKGGEHTITNLAPVHAVCNLNKGSSFLFAEVEQAGESQTSLLKSSRLERPTQANSAAKVEQTISENTTEITPKKKKREEKRATNPTLFNMEDTVIESSPHFLPSTFTVSPNLLEWANAHVEGIDIYRETDKFRDHFTSNRKKYTDWPAAWRNWMRNAYKWEQERKQKQQLNNPSINKKVAL